MPHMPGSRLEQKQVNERFASVKGRSCNAVTMEINRLKQEEKLRQNDFRWNSIKGFIKQFVDHRIKKLLEEGFSRDEIINYFGSNEKAFMGIKSRAITEVYLHDKRVRESSNSDKRAMLINPENISLTKIIERIYRDYIIQELPKCIINNSKEGPKLKQNKESPDNPEDNR